MSNLDGDLVRSGGVRRCARPDGCSRILPRKADPVLPAAQIWREACRTRKTLFIMQSFA